MATLALNTHEYIKNTELAIHRDFEELQLHIDAKMVELKADLIKWVIGISAAQAALIVTLVKFIK